MERLYSDKSTLTMTYDNLCLFLRHLGRPDLTEDMVNDFIELEIEAGNIEVKETRLLENSLYLRTVSSLPLSKRTFNILIRALPISNRKEEERTIGEVMRRIPYLSGVMNCGIKTATEIVEVFRDAGVNVDQWAEELKHPFYKTNSCRENPFPDLKLFPRREGKILFSVDNGFYMG